MGIIPEHKAKVKPGQEFGHWTVIGRPFSVPMTSDSGSPYTMTFVVCQCNCGTVSAANQNFLRNGVSRSCGCHRFSGVTTHGDSSTRLYNTWTSMKNRCHNPKAERYDDYGGRGITVCDEWFDFQVFRSWALENGYSETMTIERVKVDCGYNPENCTWIPMALQARNRRNTLFITAFGETKSAPDWAEDERCKCSYEVLRHRITKNKFDPESAITTPLLKDGRARWARKRG